MSQTVQRPASPPVDHRRRPSRPVPRRAVDFAPTLPPLPFRRAAAMASRSGLLLGDALAFVGCALAAVALRSSLIGPSTLDWAIWSAGLAWFAMRGYAQLYSSYGIAPPEQLRRSVVTTAVGALVHAAAILSLRDQLSASRLVSLALWAMLLPTSTVVRGLVQALLVRLRLFGRPVVVIGAGEVATELVQDLKANRAYGLVPVAAFDDDPRKVGRHVGGVPVVGTSSDAMHWRAPYPVKDVLIAMPSAGGTRAVELARGLVRHYPNVQIVTDILGIGSLWVRPRAIGRCIAVEVMHDRFERRHLVAKRAFDLLLALPLLLLAAPVIALAALAVKLASRGPAFYSQIREGIGGRHVRVWKIRTMCVDAEERLREHLAGCDRSRAEWSTTMKLRRDPRIIPWVGRCLRQSSIDELPQLWNVVRGDLSLVGPRPFPNYHLEAFPDEFRELRRQVRPGITGYWQVTARSDSDLRVQEASDSYYIHNWSIWLDLWILARTGLVVVTGKGAH